jgi:hypothetical protein
MPIHRGKRVLRPLFAHPAPAPDEARAEIERTTTPARDGIEAQYGLNDIFPGDPYPVAPNIEQTERNADVKLLEEELAGLKEMLRVARDEIERHSKGEDSATAPLWALITAAEVRATTAERERDEARAEIERLTRERQDWMDAYGQVESRRAKLRETLDAAEARATTTEQRVKHAAEDERDRLRTFAKMRFNGETLGFVLAFIEDYGGMDPAARAALRGEAG